MRQQTKSKLVGLVLAGKDTWQNFQKVRRCATMAGIAGQLRDDILGLFGDPEITGKSNIFDIIEGKRTLFESFRWLNSIRQIV